ncbi:TPA: hypothetical protein ACH3X1_000090 [Trebouxia sp. C0004]
MTPPRQKRRTTPQNYSQGRSRAANIGKRGLYHCNYCQKDITSVVRIKCAICQDFDLCLDCFSVGVEITPHRNDHAYRVMDSLSFPLYHPDWGADEEMLLLEAIDNAGFGNWTAVADHVGTKSKDECKGHYFVTYVDSPQFPEPWPAPQMTASAAGPGPQGQSVEMQESLAAESGVQHPRNAAESTDAETAHGPRKRIKMDTSGQEASDDITLPYQHSQHPQAAVSGISRSRAANGASDEAAGDTEQHAHKALKPRGINHKDAQGYETATSPPHPTTAGNHMAAARDPMAAAGDQPGGIKDHMTADLQEGEAGESTPNLDGGSRVPAGHLDHGLPAEGLRMHADPAGTDGATEGVTEGVGVSGRAAPNAANASQALNKKAAHEVVALAGFHIKRQEFEPEYDNEAEMIVADMEFRDDDTEEDIQEKVRVIDIYNTRLTERERRRRFVMERKLINVRKQQNLDRRRNPAEREMYARLKAVARYLPHQEFEVLSDGVVTETRLRTRIQELKEYRRAGIRTFADAELYEADKKRKSTVQPSLPGPAPGSLPRNWQYPGSAAAEGWAAGSVPRTASATVLPPSRKGSGLPLEGLRSAAPALAAWRARRGIALDITALPGMALLSARERELCAQARLLPVHYLELKALMMREGHTKGYISRQEARTFFRLEPAKAVRVYELLLAAGWLPAAPNAQGALAAAPAQGTLAATAGVSPVQDDSVASIADQPLQY